MPAPQWPTLRLVLKGSLLVGLVVIGVGIGAYTVHLTNATEKQADLTTSLIATLAGPVLFSETPDLNSQRALQEAIDGVDFPFVFTDRDGRPIIWNERQVGVALPQSYEELRAADPRNPTQPWLEKLLARIEQLDRENPPLEVAGPGGEGVLGHLHYGRGSLSRQLVWVPLLEAALILIFMGAVLLAFRSMKASEQRSIWVGMAKETAHQMGTPLTSLNGWLALLRDPESLRGSETTPDQVLDEVQHDVDRLAKVSSRFSQIGSTPKRVAGRVDEVVAATCDYFRTRLPHLGKKVVIETELDRVPEAPINAQLLDWAVENLLKNALDAIDKPEGRIFVRCREDAEGMIEIEIEDNGRGMSRAVQQRIFDPGFSTKQRGWGMGMALVRRIVSEYHGGSVALVHSAEGRGSRFRIRIPTA